MPLAAGGVLLLFLVDDRPGIGSAVERAPTDPLTVCPKWGGTLGPVAVRLGFCSRTGSAVAVALAIEPGGGRIALAGRWAVELTDPDTPEQLFHAAAALPPAEADPLVRTGTEVVAAVATHRMRDLLTGLGSVAAVGVITGDHPVPDAVTRILASHALMHAAEGQLYRDALLEAAAACGLPAYGIPKARASELLAGDLAGTVAALGTVAGRPWRKEHKLAAVAALTAAPA